MLVKVGKVRRKSGETGELAHKQGLGIFHTHTPEEFLHYCADTDVLRYGCGGKKIEFPQKQQLQHRQMHSRGRVGVSLGKVNDSFIDSHSICG